MRPAKLWPLAVVAVLLITVGANALIIYLASAPDSAVVERDYYHRAVRWDSTMAEARRGRELGWRLAAELGPAGRAGAVLAVRLEDRDGAPLEGAVVRVEALHNLEAARPVGATLAPEGGGRYAALLPLRRLGMWELRFEVTRGSERYTESLRREAAAGREEEAAP